MYDKNPPGNGGFVSNLRPLYYACVIFSLFMVFNLGFTS